jgi:hypothetical protein
MITRFLLVLAVPSRSVKLRMVDPNHRLFDCLLMADRSHPQRRRNGPKTTIKVPIKCEDFHTVKNHPVRSVLVRASDSMKTGRHQGARFLWP